MRGFKLAAKITALGLCTLFLVSCAADTQMEDRPAKPVSFLYHPKEVYSSRYESPETDQKAPVSMETEGFTPLFENEALLVFIRKKTGAIRVQDRKTGYVWGSLAADKPENLNKKWSKLGNSLIAADIFDKKGNLNASGTSADELSWRVSGQTLSAHVRWKKEKIQLDFDMTLLEDGLRFSLKGDSVKEEGDCKLGSVYFLPFFGSVAEDTQPGYVFLPDGCGSLVRFQKSRNYLRGFEKKVYGPDLGMDRLDQIHGLSSNRTGEYMTGEETLTAPLFGVVHGVKQNAFFTLVEEGAVYAKLRFDPAGLITDYNRAYMAFDFRQTFKQPFNKEGQGIETVQPEKNPLNITLSYHFLHDDQADYVGFACAYRDLLTEKGVLTPMKPAEGLPMQVDFLAADVQEEFIGQSVNQATSLPEIQSTAAFLSEKGVRPLRVGLIGWQKGGKNGCDKTGSANRTVYGSLSALDDLQKQLAKAGGSLSLSVAPFTGKKGQGDMRSEIGISMSQSAIVIRSEQQEFLGDQYYFKPHIGLTALQKQAETMTEKGLHMQIDDVGHLLYGEYLADHVQNRAEVQTEIAETAKKLSGKEKLSLVRPNDYLFSYAGQYVSVPMVNSQYLFQSDTVPFLQIVLSGSMELFAPYTNIGFFAGSDLLKIIDYNCCPSFLLTGKDNYSLRKTASSGYRSTKISDWEPYMVQAYAIISQVLEPVMGQKILSRTMLQKGVSKTTYENGSIYVNYNQEAVTADGIHLKGSSAVFTDGKTVKRGELT